jgi:hypothetical protein
VPDRMPRVAGEVKPRRSTMPVIGHDARAGIAPRRIVLQRTTPSPVTFVRQASRKAPPRCSSSGSRGDRNDARIGGGCRTWSRTRSN